MTRGKLEHFARALEIMLTIVIIGFIFSFVLLISEVDFSNLYPITFTNIGSIVKGGFPVMATWTQYILIFFIAHKAKNVKNIKKHGLKSGIFLTILSLCLIIITVGIFGADLTKLFSIPYFISLKQIDILNKIYGLESIFLSLLMMADYAAAGVMVYLCYEIIRNIFNLADKKQIITPIIFSGYIFALLLANNRFEMQIFSEKIGIYVSLIMEIIIPMFLLIVGKIRKKV